MDEIIDTVRRGNGYKMKYYSRSTKQSGLSKCHKCLSHNKYLSLKTKTKEFIKAQFYDLLCIPLRQGKKIAEMKILWTITGRTLLDRGRSENIRSLCEVQNIGEWTHNKKRNGIHIPKERLKIGLQKERETSAAQDEDGVST